MGMRINVTDMDDEGNYALAGWFDLNAVETFVAHRWSGEFRGQRLHRTRGGRWVVEWWSRWEGERNVYGFVSAREARDWLIASGDNDDAVERFFGPLLEESGPAVDSDTNTAERA